MPPRDLYHDAVRHALTKDGWTITDDPYVIRYGTHRFYVDLGAQRLLAAEKGELRIAVEVKSFLSPSEVDDLQEALGQYLLYEMAMAREDPGRLLYLGVPLETWEDLFSTDLGRDTLLRFSLRIMVFDPDQEEIAEWTN